MFSAKFIKDLLKQVNKGKISVDEAFGQLKDLPYQNLEFARVDCHRHLRKGFPEVIYAPGKTDTQIIKIAGALISDNTPLLITRAELSTFKKIKKKYPGFEYNSQARAIYREPKTSPRKTGGLVLVMSAGTGDIPVAEEAVLTASLMGRKTAKAYDVGVAGLHRLLDKKDLLAKARVIVVVAGMEGALASVVGGLTDKPIVAVPTSIGYGANFEGMSALLTMLNCCSPGVSVVNIDNGFGAGYFAAIVAAESPNSLCDK